MSIFDKVNKMAKNVTEKASDAIEITQINTKIAEENRNVIAYQKKISEIIWNKFEAGEILSPELAVLCQNIKNSKDLISGMMTQIQKLKEEDALVESNFEKSVNNKKVNCPACGSGNTEETKFCGECGAKL